jgi:hypothetical protein
MAFSAKMWSPEKVCGLLQNGHARRGRLGQTEQVCAEHEDRAAGNGHRHGAGKNPYDHAPGHGELTAPKYEGAQWGVGPQSVTAANCITIGGSSRLNSERRARTRSSAASAANRSPAAQVGFGRRCYT